MQTLMMLLEALPKNQTVTVTNTDSQWSASVSREGGATFGFGATPMAALTRALMDARKGDSTVRGSDGSW
jgi:hypothetical protein